MLNKLSLKNTQFSLNTQEITKKLFSGQPFDFNQLALEIYAYQVQYNPVYRRFVELLGKKEAHPSGIEEIPFLPIELFKTHWVSTAETVEKTFLSSGTTGTTPSRHPVKALSVYHQSMIQAFNKAYGDFRDYVFLGLLPSYMEREGSSLLYMVDYFMKHSHFSSDCDYFLYDHKALKKKIEELERQDKKIILIGVSYALLDFVEKHSMHLKNTIVMETGGMKGRRKELIKSELHERLCKGFGVSTIHSEYGMTELLSQAYSSGSGIFKTSPTMRILIRDPYDPLHLYSEFGKRGGINVIDLSNIHSCSFIATQDLGEKCSTDSFKIHGRFDHADLRGCNLLVEAS